MLARLFNPVHGLGHANLKDMHEAFSLKIFGVPLFVGTVCAFWGPSSDQMVREFRPGYRSAFGIAGLTIVAWLFMNSNISQEFVYFKF